MNKSIKFLTIYNKIIRRGYDELGNPRPFSSREFFEISDEIGANQRSPHYVNLFNNLAQWSIENLNLTSSLEIGCGPGYFVAKLNSLGIDATGIDGNYFSKKFYDTFHSKFSEKYRIDPYFKNDYGQKDVLFSIECFEHIEDIYLDKIMEKVKNEIKPKFIVFSSTPNKDPNENWDYQWGHINIKSPPEWDQFFLKYGYKPITPKPPVTEWAKLYKRLS
jgi:2-polyprenyl-3-methyl-5-hydroxy-6-metoxy-1,4-benzoquinol methylase